eukprot:3650535-Rhodomonas_salina.1
MESVSTVSRTLGSALATASHMAAVSALNEDELQPTRHACNRSDQSAPSSVSRKTAVAPIAPPALPSQAASSPQQWM